MTIQKFMSFMEGTGWTLALTLVSVALGIVLALVIAFMRMGKLKFLRGFSWVYVWVFRGTPLLLQILIVYFSIPIMYKNITGEVLQLTKFSAGIIALTLNTGAYISEIVRAAIQSIDKGQLEAAKALGMNKSLAMRKVIIPQTIKRIIPPFANEFTLILKDSSLVSSIGLGELVKVSREYASGGDWTFYFYAGAIYLFLTTISTFVFDKLEKRAGRYE